MSIIDDIRSTYRHGGTLIRLLLINVGVFAAYALLRVVLFLAGQHLGLTHWLAVPAHLGSLLLRPWTLLTYMFFHENLLHILFNMLCLWWFGQIFMQNYSGKQLRGVYLLGGLSGAVLFVVAYNLLPAFNAHGAMALGASASVMAVMLAAAATQPNRSIGLLFIGMVPLKYVALGIVLIDVVSIPLSNAGGHIAHLGGAIYGLAFARLLARGRDISCPLAALRRRKQPSPPSQGYAAPRRSAQEQRIDQILDKISRSGYDSLSPSEKAALFRNKGGSA